MKVIAVNGSPRKTWNTATLLEHALAGAAGSGAETELVHLYDLEFKGCISCFACKKIGGKNYGRCAVNDGLTPILKKISEADALILGTPVYFGAETGEMRSFLERLMFPFLTYTPDYAPIFPGKLQIGLVYTMNIAEKDLATYNYDKIFAASQGTLSRIFGNCELLLSTDTYQFSDYSKYLSTSFDAEAKKKRREVAGLAKAKADLESFIVSKNETSSAKKEEFINDRVTYIKNMAELVSKRNKIEPTPCLSEKVNARIPDIIIDVLCEYLKADPRVFKTKKFKRFGYPSVIFVPGCGNGIYSYDYNAFIFPIFPATNYKESVVSAMVLYRWDCDEDREFREAYNSLKPYKKLSFVDLQRSLIKDFTIYITKELKGYKLFDKELRDWFAWQIAPKKDEVVDFEVLKHGESRRESKLADASRRSDDKAGEASLRAAEAAAKCSAAEKLMMEAELALNEAHETALKIAAEAARVSEEAAAKSVEAARADISVKAEFMIKAAEASGKATEATIKAAEAARSENEAKINFEAKKTDYERLKNEAEVSQRIAKNEETKANEARASEDAKIASIKAGLGEMLKLAAAEENEARQTADKLKNEADQVKNDMQAKQSAAFKAEIAYRTAAEVMNSVNGLLKLSDRDLLKAKSYDELKNEAAAKVEAQAVAEAPAEEQQGFSESESADMRALFEEQLIALKDEIEKLKKENGELRKAGAGQGAQPNQHTASVSQQPGAEIPAGEKFAAVREFLYGKIKSIIKSDNVNEKLAITPSGKNKEAVNIHLTDVNAANGELDLILNTLAIQAKLQKFIEMIK